MTIEEFVKTFKKLFNQIDDKNRYAIFCLIDDKEEGMYEVFGHCCPGCIAEKISMNLHLFSHNLSEKESVH